MSGIDLFIGITSWNSSLFLPHCLESINKATNSCTKEVWVIDNQSSDSSVELAKAKGANVLVEKCSQAQALNKFVSMSNARYTLMLHSDVILLNADWFAICTSKLDRETILISPEDIGCGPLSRPFGLGKPESSFLLFDTKALKKCRQILWKKKWRLSYPYYAFNFRGSHITHDIPNRLNQKGLGWHPMNVYASNYCEEVLFKPDTLPPVWSDELGHLKYGLGNFYGVDNTITHYHNWYDRVISDTSIGVVNKTTRTFPSAFINEYSHRFLNDYREGNIDLPSDLSLKREPKAL